MTGGTLIIGASQAGMQIAASLRELGDTHPITLVGGENHLPYQRPPLSKGFLAGKVEATDLICGERVTGLALAADGPSGSGVATTASGRQLPFDRLALTVGGRARRLRVPGHDLAGICYLRNVDDAVQLRAQLPEATNVVVVGGGFIGLESAAAAQEAGKNVTVVEVADRLIARAVAPVVSEFYREAHERRGTTVLLGTGVAGFTGADGQVTGVRLSNGTERPADLVLVGVGLEPRTELAEAIGLECDGGIVVDAFSRTSKPGIVAAGDCTVLPHPLTGLGRIRIESVQNAVAQARVAAAALTGHLDETRAVPWFWSDQSDIKLQIAGLNADYDSYVVRGDPATESFSVLYYRGTQLVAADAINSPRDYMTVRKTLSVGANIAPELATDTGIGLKELVTIEPQSASA